jgi:hypothetical protein
VQGPNLEIRPVGDDGRLILRQKFTDEEQRVSRGVIVVVHPGLVSPTLRPLPSLCLPQTLTSICGNSQYKFLPISKEFHAKSSFSSSFKVQLTKLAKSIVDIFTA